MPITEIQRKSGSLVGNGGTTDALDAPTTAGNVVVILVSHNTTITTPTGFAKTGPTSTITGVYWKATGGGETTFTFPAPGASRIYSYDVVEFEGLDSLFPVDVVTTSVPGGATVSTNRSTTYDGLAIGVWGSLLTASTTPPTFSGHTDSFVEQDDHGDTNGTDAVGMSFATKPAQSLDTFSCTATATGGTVHSVMVVFTAQGAKREPKITDFWGFSPELSGYPACHSVSPSTVRYWETQTGSPTIDADGLRLQGTASIQNIQGDNRSTVAPKAALERIRFRINSVSGDLEICKLRSSSGGAVDHTVLTYRSASQKLGLKLADGIEQLSDATVSIGSWIDLDLRVYGETTAFVADWRLNYGAGWVDQAQASVTASIALGGFFPHLGWTAASTGDVSYAYAAYSITPGHYPLGDYQVVFLGPDTSATPTVLGTSSNFRRFTANGTIDGAYNAAAIMAAIDDWPPTFGASADGLAVVTADALGIRIPMATYDGAANGSVIRAVRPVIPLWAAAATAATIRLEGWDGSASIALYGEADPNADTSSTPPWVSEIWRPANGWTQAKLDAAALTVICNDATPDIAIHAAGMEALFKLAEVAPIIGEVAEAAVDPDTSGIVTVTAAAPANQDVALNWSVSGTPDSQAVAASSTHTETLNAADATVVDYVEVVSENEDPDRE